jgi:hypothetical protein
LCPCAAVPAGGTGAFGTPFYRRHSQNSAQLSSVPPHSPTKSTRRRDSSRHVDKDPRCLFRMRAMMTRTAERILEPPAFNLVLYSANKRGNRNTMRPIAHQIAELSAKIERARRLVAEHRLHAPDIASSKSSVIAHDLTHWLSSLEARREELLRQSRLIAQRDREVA